MTDTLKSICEQCVHLHDPQLEFVPEDSHRQRAIILRDLRELVLAASHEQERSVLLLAGSLLEAILYCFIQNQSDYIAQRRGEFKFRPEQDLGNFVNIFNTWFSDLLKIPDLVVAYRNTIHIDRELSFDDEVCPRGARDLIRQLNLLLEAIQLYTSQS
jgi:hypothetical protein